VEISKLFEIAPKLADELVELHKHGGIELELWDTAYALVKEFYHTEEIVQIIVRDKIVK
jgi:hypothetical protein